VVMSFEAWPRCAQCGGRHFERRPFVSNDNICLDCGYVSKLEQAMDAGRTAEARDESISTETETEIAPEATLFPN
jgi:hypothetical protein